MGSVAARHTSAPNVYVERYGQRLFTLFNDSDRPKETTLTINARALNLPATTLTASNLLTNAQPGLKRSANEVRITLKLQPEEAAVIELK